MSTKATLPVRTPGSVGSWLSREPIMGLRHEFDDLLRRFPFDWDGGWTTEEVVPSLDLTETNGDFEVKVDVPGFEPDEIDVEVTGDTLRISGEHKEEKEEKGKKFHRTERRTGSFSRTVQLPCPVVEEKVEAESHEGVLTITMPKTEEARTRKIKVKTT